MIASIATLLLWRYHEFREALRDPILRWPVAILVISMAGLITYPVSTAWTWIDAKRKERMFARRVIARLGNLTPSEKHVLGEYLQQESTVNSWGRGIGVVNALARDSILSLLVSDEDPKNLAPDVYSISELAWKHLHRHPELVDLEKR